MGADRLLDSTVQMLVRLRLTLPCVLAVASVVLVPSCRSAQPTLSESKVETPPPVVEVAPPAIVPDVPPIAAVQPEPPRPEPFADLTHVTVEQLFAELEQVAADLERDEDVRADYAAFVEHFELPDTDALYRDYVRVKLAFEATRDGGFWNLRWAITNRKPNSEQIWAQWGKLDPSRLRDTASATAECDELSALFAFVARGLGVDRIGLFWPTWNHVVAVWTVDGAQGDPVRVVVPTSQIFLGARDTLGTTGLDPWTQKTIYTYKRRDVRKSHRVSVELARFFVQQARQYADRPQSELQSLRNDRSRRLGGS